MELTAIEARILGCLVEKEATTPDGYPLTTNALVSACNQKTNRDPVVTFTAVEVDAALLTLRQKGFVRAVHIQGSRSTKHRHVLPEAIALSPAQVAILTVLLLRGAQTVGELRGRSERIHAFEALEEVDAILDALAAHEPPLARQLPRAPGQKESRWIQLMNEPETAAAGGSLATPVSSEAPAVGVPSGVAGASRPAPTAPLAPSAPAVPAGGLAEEVARLRTELDDLRRQFDSLRDQLGATPE